VFADRKIFGWAKHTHLGPIRDIGRQHIILLDALPIVLEFMLISTLVSIDSPVHRCKPLLGDPHPLDLKGDFGDERLAQARRDVSGVVNIGISLKLRVQYPTI